MKTAMFVASGVVLISAAISITIYLWPLIEAIYGVLFAMQGWAQP